MAESTVPEQVVVAAVSSLVGRWRADAEVLRARGCDDVATLLESCAADLEGAGAAVQEEALALPQAARESGYSVAHLRRLIAEGRLAAVSGQKRVRVRRCSLPRKPGYTPATVRRVA